MKFTRLYPIELLFRGVTTDEGLSKDERINKVKEFFAKDKPNVIIDTITEEKGLVNTPESDFVYRVTGYSTDPGVKQ